MNDASKRKNNTTAAAAAKNKNDGNVIHRLVRRRRHHHRHPRRPIQVQVRRRTVAAVTMTTAAIQTVHHLRPMAIPRRRQIQIDATNNARTPKKINYAKVLYFIMMIKEWMVTNKRKLNIYE